MNEEKVKNKSESTKKEESKKKIDKVDKKKENKKSEVKEKSSSDKEKQTSKKEIKVSSNGYHIVQKDETVYSIARAYGTTPEKLSQLNNLKNYQIFVGKKLKVK